MSVIKTHFNCSRLLLVCIHLLNNEFSKILLKASEERILNWMRSSIPNKLSHTWWNRVSWSVVLTLESNQVCCTIKLDVLFLLMGKFHCSSISSTMYFFFRKSYNKHKCLIQFLSEYDNQDYQLLYINNNGNVPYISICAHTLVTVAPQHLSPSFLVIV